MSTGHHKVLNEAGATGGGMASAGARAKYAALTESLRSMGSVLVAFSGGVDSTFLLKAAVDALGEGASAITATSPTYPEREFNEAVSIARSLGARHIIVESNELDIPGFSANTDKRCYYCKSELFKIAAGRARSLGINCVVDGTNVDDLRDYRPGRTASKELGVRSPLAEAGLMKDEIRELSRDLGLPTWDKPSFACLSSRFPYGVEITLERLKKVEEGEELLRGLGFRQSRLRYHGETARIEVDRPSIPRLLDDGIRDKVVEGLKRIGFTYVTLDLEGYRTGSMNEVFKKSIK